MRPLQVQDVIKLLRDEIERAGSQSEWARQTGVQRTQINRVLNLRRLPPSQLCRALGLEWVIVRHAAESDGFDIVSYRDFIRTLREEINKAGSITAWSKHFGVDRSHLSMVVHKRRSPDKRILAALNLSEVLVCANESDAARNRRRQNRTSKGQPHARWQKKFRTSVRGSNRHEG